ncbi:hypothetical protein LSAT2_024263, partial [Lamellibrachia satsuma]
EAGLGKDGGRDAEAGRKGWGIRDEKGWRIREEGMGKVGERDGKVGGRDEESGRKGWGMREVGMGKAEGKNVESVK